MAKYDISYSCGHKGRIELFGKTIDREKQIYYYENYGSCPECEKAEKEKVVAKAEREFNLPEIKGVSDKQVDYARALRVNFVKKNPKLITQFRKEWNSYKGDFDKLIAILENRPHKPAAKAYFACISTNASQIIDVFK